MDVRGLRRSPVIVGRDAELAAIAGALDGARAGRGGCLLLLGEAGAGKTRLLHEAAVLGAERRLAVLAGDAPATVVPPPFGMLAAALRSWTRDAGAAHEELRPFAAGLRRVLPEWPAGGPEPGLSPEQSRLLVLEGALRLVLLAARTHGALLVLDDLHAADPETLEFLHHATASASRRPVAILGALRTGVGARAETEARSLEQRARATVLPVAPLDAAATAALLEAMLDAPAPPGLVEEVVARTDGVPLLIEHLLEAHVAAGTVRREERGVSWSGAGRGLVSPTILEIVGREVRRLPADARRVVCAAAVLGRVDPALLDRVAGFGGERLADALERAVAAGLVEAAGDRIAFRHALVLDAVSQSLLPPERAALHRRALDAIAAAHGDDPFWLDERARHHGVLGEAEAAAALFEAAARRDIAGQAPASAEAAARRGLALAPGPERTAGLQDALAEAVGAMGRWEEALRIDAQSRGPETPDRLARMARHALRLGRLDDADAFLSRAEKSRGEAGPLRALSALISLWRGEHETAIRIASEALALGEAAGDVRVICDALDVLGRASDALGRRDDAVGTFRRWADEAGRAGLRASRLQALMELGNVEYMAQGRPDGLREARALAGGAGAFTTLVLADLSLTWCLGSRGELAEAVGAAEEAVETCRHFGLDLLPHALMALGWIRGRVVPDSGEELIREGASIAPDDLDVALESHELRGDSALRTGRHEEAAAHYGRAFEAFRANPSAVPAMTPFVRPAALRAAGRHEEASAALEEARALPTRSVIVYNDLWFRVSEALVAGSGDALDEVTAAAGESGAFEAAIALVLGAEIIRGARAEAWLREALSTFERAGAETDAARARRLLRGLGAAVPRARRAAEVPKTLRDRGVSRREAQVLEMVAAGLSNTRIAEKLFLSVRTVESHVSSLLTKLGAENRAALIAFALSARRPP